MEVAAAQEISRTFAREPVTLALCGELLPLLERHYREIAHFTDIPFTPDFDQYIKIDQAGGLRAYIAREDGEIVGYAIFFVKHNIHYATSKQAVQDILYIHPDKRGFGARFMAWCEMQLRDDGCEVVYHHVKVKPELYFGELLDRMGYELIDEVWGKRL